MAYKTFSLEAESILPGDYVIIYDHPVLVVDTYKSKGYIFLITKEWGDHSFHPKDVVSVLNMLDEQFWPSRSEIQSL